METSISMETTTSYNNTTHMLHMCVLIAHRCDKLTIIRYQSITFHIIRALWGNLSLFKKKKWTRNQFWILASYKVLPSKVDSELVIIAK